MLEVVTAVALVGVFAFFANKFLNDLERELERQFPSRARAWEDSGKGRP